MFELIDHNINQNDSFIMGWYLKDTSICDDILDYYNKSNNKRPGKVGEGESSRDDFTVKKSTDVLFRFWEEEHVYYSLLREMVNLYFKKYIFARPTVKGDIQGHAYHIDFGMAERPNVQHYQPGEAFYGWHYERFGSKEPVSLRHLVFMTYLNTLTDGGETEFYYQNVKIKPEKGLTLIWPAEWTHTHRGITSNTEHKYILTGWLNYL